MSPCEQAQEDRQSRILGQKNKMTLRKTTVKKAHRGQGPLKVGPRDPCEKTTWNCVSEETKRQQSPLGKTM